MAEVKLVDGINGFRDFVDVHRPQLEYSGIPVTFWETLYRKLKDDIFDAGQVFQLYKVENEDEKWKVIVIKRDGIFKEDVDHIYLIDHAWTFSAHTAKQHLAQIPNLSKRMAVLMDLNQEEKTSEELIEEVYNKMWKFCQTYSFGGLNIDVEDQLPVWYIMDEFGSRIQHADDPSFRTVPFLYRQDMTVYSLLFPVKNLDSGDEVTRDYIEGQNHPLTRKVLLFPWTDESFLKISFLQTEPVDNFFMEYRMKETLPKTNSSLSLSRPNSFLHNIYKVYSQYHYICDYLKHPRFQITESPEEADILWLTTHFKNYEELSEKRPGVFINQFPGEYVVTVKDMLCVVCRRKAERHVFDEFSLDTLPPWLPTTYNLKTELVQFVSYFQHREAMGLDNYWICKPWNLARGLDTHITNNLSYILRLPFTGPKIAQKYLISPVLFERPNIGKVKFDVRYIVLLKSVKPLVLYTYKKFWLRFANKAFDLGNFDDYETHFTVMNYSNAPLYQMFCHEFVEKFEAQNAGIVWRDVEAKIFVMLKEMFDAAVGKPPPFGIGENPQSRAVYAVDLMIVWTKSSCNNIQPMLLEVNWTPDCQRACEYYPDFYDDVFSVLFLDDVEGKNVVQL